jgi:glycosyltransferase involved in cell wall biosynthesis
MRKVLPNTKLLATAHTVLPNQYRYPLKGRGWQIPLRWVANEFVSPLLQNLWNSKTWGAVDGVIVHSSSQLSTVQESGCKRVELIPHFVHSKQNSKGTHPVFEKIPSNVPIILVFGFVTPEKGQDIAIRAFAQLKKKAFLLIAGGIRRKSEERYLNRCERLISDLELKDKVSITGVIPHDVVGEFYKRATLVLAPFRETSGSGTLSLAFGQGAPILASNLSLNLELSQRVPGCVEFFETENIEDCAKKLETLLSHSEMLTKLSKQSASYSSQYSLEAMADKHVKFYKNFLN